MGRRLFVRLVAWRMRMEWDGAHSLQVFHDFNTMRGQPEGCGGEFFVAVDQPMVDEVNNGGGRNDFLAAVEWMQLIGFAAFNIAVRF